ncbi:hypothetical protein RE6C_05802 [Rhodopirellula europaea 6C]|uniref:Uncharacterized protein n=1 Tax=Rhodopirellula europaea 6C TaxID=1263867 RepID=M2ATW6_9BACT|nr:hypothetical protein RE6C_05802 [Rhodopirellula europaea 6C]
MASHLDRLHRSQSHHFFSGSGFDPSPSRRLTRGRTEPLWLR